jgi:hypothetical protein
VTAQAKRDELRRCGEADAKARGAWQPKLAALAAGEGAKDASGSQLKAELESDG